MGKQKISVSLDSDIGRMSRKAADRLGISLSALVQRVLLRALDSRVLPGPNPGSARWTGGDDG